MRDPGNQKFVKLSRLFAVGDMVGTNRPVCRATWQKDVIRTVTSQLPGVGAVRFLTDHNDDANDRPQYEFPVLSCDIQRSIGQDAATCNLTFYNMDNGSMTPEGVDTYGRVGYYTAGRGEETAPFHSVYKQFDSADDPQFVTSWGYPRNAFRDVFIPNTIIRTYQGYGSGNFDQNGNERHVSDPLYVHPHDDDQLFLTGTWLIDRVSFSASGQIHLECRDMAKLLIEQYIYPPMVPIGRFPLIYCPAHGSAGAKETVGRNVLSYHSSSVDPWYGKNASVHGHRGTDAMDGRPSTFWLSVGNGQPNAGYSFEWVQGKAQKHKINEVLINTYGGNYVCYVSVMENGQWKGTNTVPYDPNNVNSFPNGANIKYVQQVTVGPKGKATIVLPRTYDAEYVRVCFTNLQPLGFSGFPYRAGLREFTARLHVGNTFKPAAPDGMVGKDGTRYIKDWSEPIKELCAWAGFTWPDATPNLADVILGMSKQGKPLRIWGDFEEIGAGPIVCTPGDFFVSKSFMEGIRQIVDFIGGIFFIDEYGGANFRLPNIFSGGNFITDPTTLSGTEAHTPALPVELHENANLLDYQVTIDDSQVRSEVLVIGGYPKIHAGSPVAGLPVAGGYVLGFNSVTNSTSAIDFSNVLAGQYRLFAVPGDATKLFFTERECQRMAELIALFILFTYRKGQASIPGDPRLQIDDQVRIFERVTYETYIHYVSGIQSSFDALTGSYKMELTTHWLGKDPNTQWFVNKAQLTPAVTQLAAIVKRVGRQAGGDNFEQPVYGV